jgi:hypothetical protein
MKIFDAIVGTVILAMVLSLITFFGTLLVISTILS